MEVEAKFALSNKKALKQFKELDNLAGYTLSPGEVVQIRDLYLDAAKRQIFAAGYALRWRKIDKRMSIDLKGLGGVEGAIHRREEMTLKLPPEDPGETWRNSQLYARIYAITGEAALQSLFLLDQTRIERQLWEGERLIAEMGLDAVTAFVGDEQHAYFELEIELTSEGSEADLAILAAHLQEEWQLKPLSSSKFERALAILDAPPPAGALLRSEERTAIQQIAGAESDTYRRRALALLALDEDALAAEAGTRANLSARRVRYWLKRFEQKKLDIFPSKVLIRAQIALDAKTPPAVKRDGPLPKSPGLTADDSMAEAARKTLYFHLQRMLEHEAGTRLGEDIEELHDMRVATRRMRAAMRVFGDYLNMEEMRPFVKRLRKTGRVLGVVRDLDVFWEKTQSYLDSLPEAHQSDLEPLREAWDREREAGREKMLAYLDSMGYRRFKENFTAFLQTPNAAALPPFNAKGEPRPYRLQHVAPAILYQRLAAIRAYEAWVVGPKAPLERLHQLRIECKRLRYTLEFFREALGPDAKKLIREIKSLQDHLGDLQDAVVASAILQDFLTWGTWGVAKKDASLLPAKQIVAPGVVGYLAYRQAELENLVDAFPQAGKRMRSAKFGRLLAGAIEAL